MTTIRTTAPAAHDARPAYMGDATDGDRIIVAMQKLDTTGATPVVIDFFVETVIHNPTRFNAGTGPAVEWIDDDGATHRNAVNVHIWIMPSSAPIVQSELSDITPNREESHMSITPITIDSITIDPADTESAVAAYTGAEVGMKTKIRNAIKSAMESAIRNMDLSAAQSWMSVSDAIAAAKPVVAKIDPNRVVADRAIALLYAAHRLIMGDVTPDGIDESDLDRDAINAMIDDYKSGGDPDAVSTEVGAAGDKIARTKITRSAERGSIEDHIATAFNDVPVGTKLTVRQIAVKSGAKSDGAIAARVWPRAKSDGTAVESTLDFTAMGVRPCTIDGVRGMEKIAD